MKLFKVNAEISKSTYFLLGVGGVVFVVGGWFLLTMGPNPLVERAILPNPLKVFKAYKSLYTDNELVKNASFSIGINLAGYVEAILISIPFGFLIGLIPLFKGAFQRQVDAIRYIPLTAVTGIFLAWFGIGIPMKAHFLAFGIIIYLLPIIVQRIREVDEVYLKTVYTLGATDWQTIKNVYFPSVISRISDDIRVLTAISWTYIIVAENIGNEGGLGATIYRAGQRQGRFDKVFALIILIMVIGVVQDKLLVALDKKLFPHKYQAEIQLRAGRMKNVSVLEAMMTFALEMMKWLFFAGYLFLLINEFTGIFSQLKLFSYLFNDTAWAVHLIILSLFVFKVSRMFKEPIPIAQLQKT